MIALFAVAGCASPTEEDDADDTSGAATADATVQGLADFRTFFEASTFKVTKDIRFNGKDSVQIGPGTATYGVCYAIMPKVGVDAVVPLNDVYAIDTAAITLFRDTNGLQWWRIPLRDETVKVGNKGDVSDFRLECGGASDGKPMDTRVITYGLRRGGFTLSGPNIKFFGD